MWLIELGQLEYVHLKILETFYTIYFDFLIHLIELCFDNEDDG